MDLKTKILNTITSEQMLEIMQEMNIPYKETRQADLVFQSQCHGSNSFKLYYYNNTNEDDRDPAFHCFSQCGQMSIFSLIMKLKNISFVESLDFFAKKLGIGHVQKPKPAGFNMQRYKCETLIEDKDYKKIKRIANKKEMVELPEYNDSVFNAFIDYYPESWVNDGISKETMDYFGIKMKHWDNKIVIPHRDINGRLVGIRVRSLKEWDVENGRKYMPLKYDGKYYSHPTHYNMFGVYENRESIKRQKKIMLVEGEKSVLVSQTIYGEDNFTVALMGTSISQFLVNQIVFDLGVEEVIIAFDRENKDKEFMTSKDERHYKKHKQKIQKIADKFKHYCRVYSLEDDDGEYLNYKDSPVDKGKEVLEKILRNKRRIY